jgi:uncharacterized membrane protein YeaQ/YmgE (transglycosylase-associated protein family)
MTLTSLPELVLLVVVAALCGAVGRALARAISGWLVVPIALGYVGALLGPWLTVLKLRDPLIVNISGLWSIIGAALFVAITFISPAEVSRHIGTDDAPEAPPRGVPRGSANARRRL